MILNLEGIHRWTRGADSTVLHEGGDDGGEQSMQRDNRARFRRIQWTILARGIVVGFGEDDRAHGGFARVRVQRGVSGEHSH